MLYHKVSDTVNTSFYLYYIENYVTLIATKNSYQRQKQWEVN